MRTQGRERLRERKVVYSRTCHTVDGPGLSGPGSIGILEKLQKDKKKSKTINLD